MQAEDVPLLPRGVRCHFDTVRKVDVLLGPERVLMLDQIGLAILQRTDGEASIAQISDDLAQTYEAEREVIEPDVIAYLQDLRERGFVHVRSA
ncbi:pyrroloquinoline quinone biosynthesis peptide chaperone PqqD [Roseobacter sinensis]|uniref:Pyrroloquinoline quinone biosynthesis peptide chaperone PqqD n=1 Tax=Roseobacter sinensis TaxID=2931391 RepID=A0ABT3BAX3_9RHOB|nr:pyrroloquinoline quinone biosynthesis peptide chaperone PqqD [Roseobacter sp. WL0113]MCV3270724.1 pyrroloquinoline quinone biosynthesis peptide chaperone PqqD [Roseobacter sp. WL0113]